MKNAITLFVVVLLMSSCRSVQKMVDRGEYDQAIAFAAKKLHGKKSPKTKHVKGLEEAFAKVMHRDLQRIDYLKGRNDATAWDAVYDLYRDIQDRQNQIRAFLPLVSKDGYAAHFQMINPVPMMRDAADQAMALHYEAGEHLLQQDDKLAARRAMRHLEAIRRYRIDYKDVHLLKQKALDQGTTRVAVSVVNKSRDYLPAQVQRRLQSLDLAGLSQPWVEYYYADDRRLDTDVQAVIEIDRVLVSPGLIDRERWTEKKAVEVERLARIDSLGIDKVVVDYDTVFAQVRSARFTREAKINARLVYYDYQTGAVLSERPVDAVAVFDERGVEYDGDRRALTAETEQQLRSFARLRLPEADELLADAGDVMKSTILSSIHYEIR